MLCCAVERIRVQGKAALAPRAVDVQLGAGKGDAADATT
jgi:hypothetical protein